MADGEAAARDKGLALFHEVYGDALADGNGLTRAELKEIFLTSIPYCGFPAANVTKAAMLQAFAELDAAADG